jgi:hypothetical protein
MFILFLFGTFPYILVNELVSLLQLMARYFNENYGAFKYSIVYSLIRQYDALKQSVLLQYHQGRSTLNCPGVASSCCAGQEMANLLWSHVHKSQPMITIWTT